MRIFFFLPLWSVCIVIEKQEFLHRFFLFPLSSSLEWAPKKPPKPNEYFSCPFLKRKKKLSARNLIICLSVRPSLMWLCKYLLSIFFWAARRSVKKFLENIVFPSSVNDLQAGRRTQNAVFCFVVQIGETNFLTFGLDWLKKYDVSFPFPPLIYKFFVEVAFFKSLGRRRKNEHY